MLRKPSLNNLRTFCSPILTFLQEEAASGYPQTPNRKQRQKQAVKNSRPRKLESQLLQTPARDGQSAAVMASAGHSESPEVIITVAPPGPAPPHPALRSHHSLTIVALGPAGADQGPREREQCEHRPERLRPTSHTPGWVSSKGGVTETSETLVCKCGSSCPAPRRRALPTGHESTCSTTSAQRARDAGTMQSTQQRGRLAHKETHSRPPTHFIAAPARGPDARSRLRICLTRAR